MDNKLFIGGKPIDCSEDLSLPITYTLEDLSNPVVVRNSYSKSITVPATPSNNAVFGSFWKLDRYQEATTYNPSKRVDFELFSNGEVVESGYCELNNVSLDGAIKSYDITLYGGLGDFFYGLKYNEDGSTKTLADLVYRDKNNPKDELDFVINKDFVNQCFSKNWATEGNEVNDIITFFPANNGVYEKFDSSHCLINTTEEPGIFKKVITDGDKEYTTKNGFALASLSKDYTEWEMRDLRSYQQRPAIKVSKLLKAIFDNSGYEVTLDPTFFNKNNPYWDKTFIALPLLSTNADDSVTEVAGRVSGANATISGTTPSNSTKIRVTGDNITTSGEVIDLSHYPQGSTFTVDVDFSLRARTTEYSDTLYTSAKEESSGMELYQAISAQLIAYDESSGTILGNSDLYYFTNNDGEIASNPEDWYNYTPRVTANNSLVNGSFKKNGVYHYFTDNDGNNTFRLTLWKVPKADSVRIVLYLDWRRNNAYGDYSLFPDTYFYGGVEKYTAPITVIPVTQDTFELKYTNTIKSGMKVTKAKLLKTEQSPADFLLSYTKLFGLYFTKDVQSKKISILTRKEYFLNKINDWNSRIDRGRNITVNPILFDKKWYQLSLEAPETYFYNKYKSKYAVGYGQKRLDTGYNFNNEVTKLYEDNIFQEIVTAVDSDKYFRSFYDKNNRPVPGFLADNATYSLYNGDDSKEESLYGSQFINPSKTVEWTSQGKDFFPKQCFFSLSSDSRDLEEITSSLVFYNGVENTLDSNGKLVKFWITDDLTEMTSLNDGEMCFLYTVSDKDASGNRIAVPRTSLPQYCSYITEGGVKYSLDFGLPKEVYHNYSYGEDATLYNQFWKSFYNDQFSVDTKRVTAFVKLNDLKVGDDLLREFYYFDNSYWILNKIDSYDINSEEPVRCEFIKVQGIDNYRAFPYFAGGITISLPNSIGANGGTLLGNVICDGDWSFSDSVRVQYGDGTSKTLTGLITVTGNNFSVSIPANEKYVTAVYIITALYKGITATALVEQAAKERPKQFVNLDQNKCIACGACDRMLINCPVGLAVKFEGNYPVIDNLSTCIACGGCSPEVCPAYGSALSHSNTAKDMTYRGSRTLEVDPTSIRDTYEGNSYTVNVTFNGRRDDEELVVEYNHNLNYVSWSNIVWDSETTGSFTITFTENESDVERTGQFVRLKTADGLLSATVTLSQLGRAVFTVDNYLSYEDHTPYDGPCQSEAGTYYLFYESTNPIIEVRYDDSILGYILESNRVKVLLKENVSDSDRQFSITLVTDDGSVTRTFTQYGTPKEETTITVFTEHCTSSVTSTTAEAGSSLSITFTPDEGYELGTPTLKAGGSFITYDSWTNGVLTFTVPENDVEVRCVATEIINPEVTIEKNVYIGTVIPIKQHIPISWNTKSYFVNFSSTSDVIRADGSEGIIVRSIDNDKKRIYFDVQVNNNYDDQRELWIELENAETITDRFTFTQAVRPDNISITIYEEGTGEELGYIPSTGGLFGVVIDSKREEVGLRNGSYYTVVNQLDSKEFLVNVAGHPEGTEGRVITFIITNIAGDLIAGIDIPQI